MTRNTIDFGIDLGTTNSEIAIIEGSDVHVFKNNEHTENTPSAIYIDRRGRLFVGRKAKERAEEDPENVRIEFKRDMGLQQSYAFAASGRVMTPEECSAEVLKSLRSDATQRSGEDGEEVRAAVITVPAMFELPACDATRRAAQMAGIEFSPLLQEPIAAAIAYGFNADADNVFWMVYDLGGGTFDASLVSVQDGRITVVDHDGENHLGGKDLDWLLVEEIVLPKLRREYALDDLRRGNPAQRTTLAKLKAAAEKVKIELSRRPTATVEVLELCEDERGQPVDVDIEVTQAEYARVIAPTVEHSLQICRRVLGHNQLSAADIEKIILVGGPTLTPALREMLKEGLGIPLDISIDPITSVARGAAIFAGAQPLPKAQSAVRPAAPGQLDIELAYEPITPDAEPFIGGTVRAAAGDVPDGILAGCRIEFVRADGGWRSGAVPVKPNGAFGVELRLRERRPNTFQIEVRDAQGNRLATQPEAVVITHGLGVDNPPLPRSLGVALANNTVQVYLAKDTQLPARGKAVHRTNRTFAKGQSGELLHIPIVEGEHPRANRNRLIGALVIPAHELRRDLRVGAEIEIRIEMDASRAFTMSAYIPELDQEFSDVQGNTASTVASSQVLAQELKQQRERMRLLQEGLAEVSGSAAQEVQQVRDTLFLLEAQDALHEVERLVDAAGGGEADAAKTADERLKDLAAQLDAAEDLLEWPRLEARAQERLDSAREAVDKADDGTLRTQLGILETELQAALQAHDKETSEARMSDVWDIWFEARQRDPLFWIRMFHVAEHRPLAIYRDQQTARRLLEDGEQALEQSDIKSLRRIVNDLWALLPARERAAASDPVFGSGIE